MDAPALAHTASLESNASNTSSSSRKKVGSDFIFGAVLGEGSYSTVLHATDTDMNREYAVKMLDKKHIIRENKVKYVTVEKKVLHMIRHPLIVKLYHTFQDTHSLYFVLEYAPNGDLLEYLNKMGRFSVAATRFYIGEIILALECIHENGVIHRDLKPENILLDAEFHIKVSKFNQVN